MRHSLRLFLAAFLTDGSLYLAFAALPFRAIELGAGPARLGALPTLYAAAYMTTATFGGRLSDRFPRLTLARAGGSLFFLGCLALSAAPNLWLLFCALPILGLGLGFFWSPVQAEVSDRAGPKDLSRAVGGFNVAWSLGKGVGLVAGGLVTEWLTPQVALGLAGLPVLGGVLALRSRSACSKATTRPEVPRGEAPRSAAFLYLAWVTNAIAFGVGSIMTVHAPKFLLARNAGPADFGVLLGVIFLTQTATFASLWRHRPSRRTLLLAQALGAAAIAVFLTAPGTIVRLASAVPLGIALGLAYQASIHTSLNREQGRGRAAGLHETILGAGSSSLPLLGGGLAALTASLGAPFILGAVALAGAFVRTLAAGPRAPDRGA